MQVFLVVQIQDACNFDLALGATIDDGSCTYPASADLDCDGNCINGGTYTTVDVQEIVSYSFGDYVLTNWLWRFMEFSFI